MGRMLTDREVEMRGGVFIGMLGDVSVFEYPGKAGSEWRTFYLRRNGLRAKRGAGRRSWHTGWNGQRVAETSALPDDLRLGLARMLTNPAGEET